MAILFLPFLMQVTWLSWTSWATCTSRTGLVTRSGKPRDPAALSPGSGLAAPPRPAWPQPQPQPLWRRSLPAGCPRSHAHSVVALPVAVPDRWKGENVSTTEVEAVMTSALLPFGVREVAAYGVQVPGHDGRAGMAAIADPEGRADAAVLAALAEKLTRRLPRYARPLFVRVAVALPMTGTHKVSKVLLQREGFVVEDPVFVFDAKAGRYERLNDDILDDIRQCRLRF